MTSSNNSFNISDIPKGSGQWQSGSVVRDIEGHFNQENVPQNAAPIDHTGGVPGVDFKDRLKEALPGHHSTDPKNTHHDTATGAGAGAGVGSGSALGGSGTDTNLGSTGTSVPTTTSSGETGPGLTSGTAASSTTGGTHGISERAENELASKTGGTGTGAQTGAGASGIQKELAEAAAAGKGSKGTTGTSGEQGLLGPSGLAKKEAERGNTSSDAGLGSHGDPATTHDSTTTSAGHEGKQKGGLLDKVKSVLK